MKSQSNTGVPPVSMRSGALYLEWILWGAGTLLLAVCVFYAAAMLFASHAGAGVVPLAAPGAGASGFFTVPPGQTPASAKKPAVVGRVEIPALHLTTPLLAGDDSMSLTEGAGHIPGTAFPGGLGTVGIAGHRDTHFRQLSHVAKDMDVRLIDQTGTYHYRVTSTEIVTPDKVSVLDIVSEPGLALVTCYPFSYLGHAPKRFIVHATLLSAAPDEVH